MDSFQHHILSTLPPTSSQYAPHPINNSITPPHSLPPSNLTPWKRCNDTVSLWTAKHRSSLTAYSKHSTNTSLGSAEQPAAYSCRRISGQAVCAAQRPWKTTSGLHRE